MEQIVGSAMTADMHGGDKPMTTTEVKKSKLFSDLSNLLRRPSMRPVVRFFTAGHVALYRLTGGKAQVAKYPTMLLTTKGRKTGKLRTTPLIYIQDGDCFVIAAAYSGSDKDPVWWLNLRDAKEAEIEVMRSKIRVRAELVTPEQRAAFWPRLVAMYPYFTDYQQRTQREIPVILLRPISTP
jgi:deazaflavin-dependent oxidoreductase (nitroreductase family)